MLEDAEEREIVRVVYLIERSIKGYRLGVRHILIAAVVQQVDRSPNLPDDAVRRKLIEQTTNRRRERSNIGICLPRLITVEQVIDSNGIRRKLRQFVRRERRTAGRERVYQPRPLLKW